MKAWVRTQYGGPEVLRWETVPEPEPGPGDVLLAVSAASVNPADRYLLRGMPILARPVFGLWRPNTTRLGQDVAGEVLSIGSAVTRFRPGDRVFGSVPEEFGTDLPRAFAERTVVPERLLAPLPAHVSFTQGAATPMAGQTALRAFAAAGAMIPGAVVLITGAAGGIGTMAIQIAKARGMHVIAACRPGKAEFLRSLGADAVLVGPPGNVFTGPARADLLVDIAAVRPLSEARRALKPNGVHVVVGTPDRGGPLGPLTGIFFHAQLLNALGSERVRCFTQSPSAEDLLTLAQMLGTGTLKPAIDRCLPMDQLPEALRALERGGLSGKIVLAA